LAARPRIILALPNASECAVIADWVAAEGMEPVIRSSPGAALNEVRSGRPFELMVADGAFTAGLITTATERNPRTPTVVIGDSAPAGLGNAADCRIMHLTRPVDRAVLLCTISMAILEGRPVRCSTRKLVNRFDAIVNNVPAHIIDVSKEGLRLELPRDRRTPPPPPYFRVALPLIGAAVTVKRMWARPWPGKGLTEVTLCGVALLQNRSDSERAWQVFVDTIASGANTSFAPLEVR